jgi:alpha-beta hydrolase superfamily lysophospholipase
MFIRGFGSISSSDDDLHDALHSLKNISSASTSHFSSSSISGAFSTSCNNHDDKEKYMDQESEYSMRLKLKKEKVEKKLQKTSWNDVLSYRINRTSAPTNSVFNSVNNNSMAMGNALLQNPDSMMDTDEFPYESTNNDSAYHVYEVYDNLFGSRSILFKTSFHDNPSEQSNGLVVLINGFLENIDNTFAFLAKKLVKNSFDVIAIEVDYLNRCTLVPSTNDLDLYSQITQFLIHIRKNLMPKTQKLLLGGSGLGASIALDIALRHRSTPNIFENNEKYLEISGLILFNPWIIEDKINAPIELRFLESSFSPSIFQFLIGCFDQYSTLSYGLRNMKNNYERKPNSMSSIHNLANEILLHRNHLKNLLSSTIFDIPTFIAHAKSDAIVNSNLVTALYKRNASSLKQIKFYQKDKHSILQDFCVLEAIEDTRDFLLELIQG